MMPDQTFDAVIVGGGSKALYLAMYLVRYAGMSVGVFEKRHEIGGGLATEEIAAPGFRGNTHAVIQLPWCTTLRCGATSLNSGTTGLNSTSTFAATAPSSETIRRAWPSTVTSMT